MDLKKPQIFDYIDFREYLKDLFYFTNAMNKKFNKAFICRELGLPNSRSYFQDILNGKIVSTQKISGLISVFNLNKEESQFFKILVKYNQVMDDPDEKSILLEMLISLNKTPKNILTQNEYSYYKDWYNSAIRAILNVINFKDDYKMLSHLVNPAISIKEAKTSIKLMKDMNIIAENSEGYLKPVNKVISTGEKIRNDIIRQYQMKCIEVARAAILQNKTQDQRITTKTISCSKAVYSKIEKKIEKVNKEITALVHNDHNECDRVYQLDILLFPLMKDIENG